MDDQKTNHGMNLDWPNRFLTGIKALDNKWNNVFFVFLLSAALGLGWFLYIYSYQPLIFSNINWIYNAGGDALQHYLGWLFYRNSPWTFPLGHISNYGYPFGINLAYTDSIPLVAIPLKLFSYLVQQRFQFIGVWVLFNYIAQIFFAILIIRLYTSSLILQIVGGSLMVLSSIMTLRAWGHSSLSAHWILLASIYLILSHRKKLAPEWAWPLILCLALLIHPYFVAMIGVLFAAYLFDSYRIYRHILQLGRQILYSVASLVIAGLLSGVIEFPSTATTAGYGLYSFNLNSLFNPLGSISAFLAPRPLVYDFQWEGNSYLGAGYFFLIIVGIGSLIIDGKRKGWLKANIFLIAACSVLTLFAITNRVTFDSKILLKIPLPQRLIAYLGIFRSSGRFFWPVMYLMVIFGILRTLKTGKWSYVILIIALLLQFFDLAPMLNGRANFDLRPYQSPLQVNFWQEAKESFRHIEMLPATNMLMKIYEPIAIYAAEQKMTLNWGYFARADYNRIYNEGVETMDRLKSGIVSSDTIYQFCKLSDVHAIESENLQRNIRFYQIDNYVLGLPTVNEVTQNLSAESGIPELNAQDFRLANFISSFDNNTIFVISGKGASFAGMDDETRHLLTTFGLKADLPIESSDGYLAIFGKPFGMSVIEKRSSHTAQVSFSAGKHIGEYFLPFNLSIMSSSPLKENLSSIRLNDKEYSSNYEGINILAYDIPSGNITVKNFSSLYPVICP